MDALGTAQEITGQLQNDYWNAGRLYVRNMLIMCEYTYMY